MSLSNSLIRKIITLDPDGEGSLKVRSYLKIRIREIRKPGKDKCIASAAFLSIEMLGIHFRRGRAWCGEKHSGMALPVWRAIAAACHTPALN